MYRSSQSQTIHNLNVIASSVRASIQTLYPDTDIRTLSHEASVLIGQQLMEQGIQFIVKSIDIPDTDSPYYYVDVPEKDGYVYRFEGNIYPVQKTHPEDKPNITYIEQEQERN